MNSLEYLRLQLRLEGKEIIDGNLLRQVEVVPGEEMPLLVLAQLAEEQVTVFYDGSLSPELREKLNEQVHSVKFPNVDPILHFLQSLEFTVEVSHYKTYIFPERYKSLSFEEIRQFSKRNPKVKAFGFNSFAEEVYAAERDERIVSACVSARENDFCGEAWVYTDEQYRHQGFAQKVVVAWAESLLSTNKIPFYSHKIENIASANLVKRLGLESVFEEIVISYAEA